jgi:hypothetical protein
VSNEDKLAANVDTVETVETVEDRERDKEDVKGERTLYTWYGE